MAFTAKDVQALREKTGVGMMDCKKALVEADGDMDKAVDILREKGLASQAKKSGRVAAEGVVAAYSDDKAGALVEINCETDFVAKGEPFVALANKIAKTACAAAPWVPAAHRVPWKNGRRGDCCPGNLHPAGILRYLQSL